MSSHRARRAASRAERTSSRRSPSPPPPKSPAPEILSNLGRVVLPFVIRKLNEKNEIGGSSSNKSKRDKSRHRDRDRDRDRERDRERDRHDKSKSSNRTRARSKSGSGSRSRSRTINTKRDQDDDRDGDKDIHSLVSQVAVGLLAVGVRQVIKKRKEAKKAAAAASGSSSAGKNDQYRQGVDPELSRALETTARELQGASESIRRLSRTAPGHRGRCEVREELVKDADRLEGTLGGIQAGIHNMRNLHPAFSGRDSSGRDSASREEGKREYPRVREWERPRNSRDRSLDGRR